jgi:hypothetical protein
MVDDGGGYKKPEKGPHKTPCGPESGAMGQDLLHEPSGSFLL